MFVPLPYRASALLCAMGTVLSCGWAGCGGDTDIIGRCEVTGEPVRVVPQHFSGPGPASIGLVGGDVLLSWADIGPIDAETGYPWYAVQFARWHDHGLRPFGEDLHLGAFQWNFRTRWVSDGERLLGQVWSDPEYAGTGPFPRDTEMVGVWTLEPGGAASRVPVDLSFATPGIPGQWSVDIGRASGAGMLPGAWDGMRWLGALTALTCGGRFDNYRRLWVFDETGHAEVWDRPPSCREDAGVPPVGSIAEHPWVFELGDGGHGLVFMRDQGQLWLSRVEADLSPAPPRRVAAGTLLHTDAVGPRAVAVGGHVLFSQTRGSNEPCFRLRVMDLDGSDAEDAPWQLPCMDDSDVVVPDVELLAMPGAALLVWAERSGPWSRLVYPADRYVERVRAVLLTSEGKRGSAVVTVTDSAAGTLVYGAGVGLPGRFNPVGASEDAEAIVAWSDARAGGPGVYARWLRCEVDR